jgi:hypothetical protein
MVNRQTWLRCSTLSSLLYHKSNLLELQKLNAEINSNPDAEALYGFLSKIVLRDAGNLERRNIITPLRQLIYKRQGIHVAVRASSNREYSGLGIDAVLRRLSCPHEPRLL